jgi:fructose-1,6-bisphosphatase-3
MGTIHVISDIHGDDVKLRHVINNASGSLRPVVERMFQNRLSPEQLQRLVTLIFYPREVLEQIDATTQDPAAWRTFCQTTLDNLLEMIRSLVRRSSLQRALELFPIDYRDLLRDLVYEPSSYQSREATDACHH